MRSELEFLLVTQVSGKVGGNVIMGSFEKRERSERGLGGRGSSSTDKLFPLFIFNRPGVAGAVLQSPP